MRPRALLIAGIGLCGLVLSFAGSAPARADEGRVEPVRLASEVFGGPIEIEVRDLPRERA